VRNSIALGRHRYRLTHEDRMWSPLPMFHIAAVLPMLAIFDVGGTYLTMGYFDAGVALKMLEKYRVTALYPSFVTIMQGLVYHPTFRETDLSRVKLMNSNFAVQPPGVAEPIMQAMPQALQVGSFGMTEAAGTVCTGGWDELEQRRITRLGKPLPGLEVRIVNPETGQDVLHVDGVFHRLIAAKRAQLVEGLLHGAGPRQVGALADHVAQGDGSREHRAMISSTAPGSAAVRRAPRRWASSSRDSTVDKRSRVSGWAPSAATSGAWWLRLVTSAKQPGEPGSRGRTWSASRRTRWGICTSRGTSRGRSTSTRHAGRPSP